MCVFLCSGWSPSALVRGGAVGGNTEGFLQRDKALDCSQTWLYHLKSIYKRAPGKLIGIISLSEAQLSAYEQPRCGNEMVSLLSPQVPGVLESLPHPQNTTQSRGTGSLFPQNLSALKRAIALKPHRVMLLWRSHYAVPLCAALMLSSIECGAPQGLLEEWETFPAHVRWC